LKGLESSRVGRFVRGLASALATLGGVALLVADSTNDCESYAGFQARFGYRTNCLVMTPGGPTELTDRATIDVPTVNDRYEANQHFERGLKGGGLNAVEVSIQFAENGCSGGDEGTGVVQRIAVTLGTENVSTWSCGDFAVPVDREETVSCVKANAGEGAYSCTLTVSP
jgi:hypothetical protein